MSIVWENPATEMVYQSFTNTVAQGQWYVHWGH